jgi:hypothetical protein
MAFRIAGGGGEKRIMVRKKLKHQLAGNGNMGGGSDALDVVHSSSPELLTENGMSAVVLPEALPGSSGSWKWILLVLAGCSLTGGLTASALVSLMSLPPATDCQKLTAVSPDMERLYCAQEAARSGELPQLIAGLELAGQWSEAHPLYNEAQRSLDEWSQKLLAIADQRSEVNMEEAIQLANRVPRVSPLYKDAQAAITRWRQYWNRGEVFEAKALKAMKNQDWNAAFQQIEEMRRIQQEQWRIDRVNALLQRLNAERQARQLVGRAFALAKGGQPDQLDAALGLLSGIRKDTHVWAELQPKLAQWSEVLLQFGFQQWQTGNLDRAIVLGQRAALTSGLKSEAQNLIRLSQARKLAMATLGNWEASPQHLFNLREAIAAARTIPAQSRFYPQAQDSILSWKTQIEDLQQLQYAQVAASLKQPATLALAMAQAKEIAPGRTRRTQAQTLVAHWSQEIQRVEDEPLLVQARKLSEPGTVPALQQAIALAGQVQSGRSLYSQAQGLVVGWTQQIQRQEDQPILNQAIALATDGDLSGAIRSAGAIRRGRMLYGQAQSLIGDWRAEIRQIELTRIRAQQAALEAQRQEAARREAEAKAREALFNPDPAIFPPIANPPFIPADRAGMGDLPQYIPVVPPTEVDETKPPEFPVQEMPSPTPTELPTELPPPPIPTPVAPN